MVLKMPFHVVADAQRDIIHVVVVGSATTTEILYEITVAQRQQRGKGISRKLIDCSAVPFTCSVDDIHFIFKAIDQSAASLETKRIAIIVQEIPPELHTGLITKLFAHYPHIKVFTDRDQAMTFLFR